jgi:predicted PhzF superfamily epimerase YddE/YHI9
MSDCHGHGRRHVVLKPDPYNRSIFMGKGVKNPSSVDVFTSQPYYGNPVAVILDGQGLSLEEMQRIAAWTNLSETTFVLPPTCKEADYLLKIFTPKGEIPFAGHPTIGSAHAILLHVVLRAFRSTPDDSIVQGSLSDHQADGLSDRRLRDSSLR